MKWRYPALSAHSKKLLVAESDEIVLALVTHLLTREGYSVDVARRSDELAQKLEKGDAYDAILLDARLGQAAPLQDPDFGRRLILLGALDAPASAFAALRKPLEFDLVIKTVESCVTQEN